MLIFLFADFHAALFWIPTYLPTYYKDFYDYEDDEYELEDTVYILEVGTVILCNSIPLQ